MTTLPRRTLGRTGIEVSILGFGGGHLGDPAADDRSIGELLNRIVDQGINLIDTAPSYGLSEERIGRHLAHRRSEIVLSTKVGYGVPGVEDWTAEIIPLGVEAALRKLRTDHLDLVHLHSCPVWVLEQRGVIEALAREKQRGTIRAVAYSGDNEAVEKAIEHPALDSAQLTVNILDIHHMIRAIPRARERGLGVIAKRPVANTAWRFPQAPDAEDLRTYWERHRRLGLPAAPDGEMDRALRFTLHHTGVDSVIIGTSKIDNLLDNLRIASRGPLPPGVVAAIEAAHQAQQPPWPAVT